MTLTNSTPFKILSITLTPVPNQGNRARAAARFTVSVALSWGPLPWSDGVLLVDARGYPLQWRFEAVGKWLVKALSGADCVVNLTVTNGAQIPARWSVSRIAAAAAKVSGVTAQSVINEADSKVQSVAAWATSDRKAAVIEAAGRMVEAAALLLVAQNVQSGGALGDAVVIPDPDPVPDPDPTPGPGVTDGVDSEARCNAVTGIYAGALLVADEVQFVGVNLVAGVSVQIDVQGVDGGAGTLVDPGFDVFDSLGVAVDVGSDDYAAGCDSRAWFVPAVSGLYFVGVYAADSGLGTYRVTVAPGVGPVVVPDPPVPTSYPLDIADMAGAPLLHEGMVKSSQFEVAGDVDYFQMDLGPHSFEVDVRPFGTVAPLVGPVEMSIYDASGSLLSVVTHFLNGPMGLTLPGSGYYYLALGCHTGYGDSLGQYEVLLHLVSW